MSDALSTKIVTWALPPPPNTLNALNVQSKPAETLLVGSIADGIDESFFGDDSRALVDPTDIQPGGKYYSIVKLQIRYERQGASDPRWAQGSGWLIQPNLLVTAGHCAFDHTYSLGKAVQVKAYVGYNGKDSIGKPGVQFRNGARILTTSGWVQSDTNKQNDVSFIQLDQAFDRVTPFTFQPTSVMENATLGVVGYPADKALNGEYAAQMYGAFKQVNCDLDVTTLNMLEYKISTYAGQSGSPILVQDSPNQPPTVSIGTHVYGLGDRNSASVIRGRYGNFYKAYQQVFATQIPAPIAGQGYTELTVSAAEDALTDPPKTDEEDFWSTLKSVANVGAGVGQAILSVGTPFLGPAAAPISGIVGTALSLVGKMTESSMGNESAMNVDTSYKQRACRAILSEAAFQTVMNMNEAQAAKYDIFNGMKSAYLKNKPHVPDMARMLAPALMEPALRTAVTYTVPPPPASSVRYPIVAPRPGTESALAPANANFAQIFSKPAGSPGTEGFFDFLGGVAAQAVSAAPTVIGAVGSILKAVGGESSMTPIDSGLQPHFEMLCHRAVMGEAALQTIMNIPPAQIKQEGFFDTIVKTVKDIGSTVIKAAPNVLSVVAPIVLDAMKPKPSTGESSLGPAGGKTPAPAPSGAPPGGRTIGSLLQSGSITQPLTIQPAVVNGIPNTMTSKIPSISNNPVVSVRG